MPRKKIGRQTPTGSRVLPYRKTGGTEATELYESSGRTARKWQKLLLKDLMAMTPKGLWKHTKFGLAVPRQKTTKRIKEWKKPGEINGFVDFTGFSQCHRDAIMMPSDQDS